MATYTMTLEEVLALGGGTYEVHNGITLVTKPEAIGLASYPIFDESYRDRLNGLIFDRYMNREIGLETSSQFVLSVRRRMNEEMGVINKLYLTAKREYDPLSTVDLTTMTKGTNAQMAESATESQNNTDSESGTRVVNQDFPQHALNANADYASSGADTVAYAESGGKSSDSANTKSTGDTTSESRTTGYQGSATDLLMRYRDSLMNVDTLVLDMLSDCFMLMWDAPTNYTERGGYLAY